MDLIYGYFFTFTNNYIIKIQKKNNMYILLKYVLTWHFNDESNLYQQSTPINSFDIKNHSRRAFHMSYIPSILQLLQTISRDKYSVGVMRSETHLLKLYIPFPSFIRSIHHHPLDPEVVVYIFIAPLYDW